MLNLTLCRSRVTCFHAHLRFTDFRFKLQPLHPAVLVDFARLNRKQKMEAVFLRVFISKLHIVIEICGFSGSAKCRPQNVTIVVADHLREFFWYFIDESNKFKGFLWKISKSPEVSEYFERDQHWVPESLRNRSLVSSIFRLATSK